MRLLLLSMLLSISTSGLWAGGQHVNAPDPATDLLAVKGVKNSGRSGRIVPKKPKVPKVENLLATEINITLPKVTKIYRPLSAEFRSYDKRKYRSYFERVRNLGTFPHDVKTRLQKKIQKESFVDLSSSNVYDALNNIKVDVKLTVNDQDDQECRRRCQKMRVKIPQEGYDFNLICYPGATAQYDKFFQVNDRPIHIGPDTKTIEKSFTINDSYFGDAAWARYCQGYPESMNIKLSCRLYLDQNTSSNESFEETFRSYESSRNRRWIGSFGYDHIYTDDDMESELWIWTKSVSKLIGFKKLDSFPDRFIYFSDISQVSSSKVEENYVERTYGGFDIGLEGTSRKFSSMVYMPFGKLRPDYLIEYTDVDDLMDEMAKDMIETVGKKFGW